MLTAPPTPVFPFRYTYIIELVSGGTDTVLHYIILGLALVGNDAVNMAITA